MTRTAREIAMAAGERVFYTGEPRKRGHKSPRYTDNGQCVHCRRGPERAQELLDTLRSPDGMVRRAQREVAQVLAKLESDTGRTVEYLDISEINVTRIEESAPQWVRQVVILMRRRPGENWA